MWDKAYTDRLKKYRKKAETGNPERIEVQHKKGKLTARERLEILFDKDTFCEVGGLILSRAESEKDKKVFGDGVITGYGLINGRRVFASSEDFTVHGGTLGEAHAAKISRIMDMAIDMRAPLIILNDSGGARIEEGICSLSGYSKIFSRHVRASGVIPQIAVIMGPCAGGACYSPALCDFIFMVKQTGLMFITGPQVVKEVIRQEVSAQELGGAELHSTKSGVVHFTYDDDRSCLNAVRELLSYLPENKDEKPPVIPPKFPQPDRSKAISDIVSDNQRKSYDIISVINSVIDRGSFFEVQPDYAPNAVVGLSRINGETVAFVANQPKMMGGVLDSDSSDKISRFIRFCDAFNVPIVTLVDVPGYLPGKEQEESGIIRHGAKVIYAYCEATVPKITIILRKAYGGAYIAMNSKEMGADIVYAWPLAEIAVMGAEGAVDIIRKREFKELSPEDKAAMREKYIAEYKEKFMNPYIAAANGFVDEVILPEETKSKLVYALEMLKSKKKDFPEKRHGNFPV